MMTRGGYPFEENSIGPGALRFDSDNRTSNKHFRQQFNGQFNRNRPESAGRRLAAAATLSTHFSICNSEHASSRRLAATTAVSTDFSICNSEHAGSRRLAAAATFSADFSICNGEHAGSRRLAATATVSTDFECTDQWVLCLRVF
jgi:hypothetical protein